MSSFTIYKLNTSEQLDLFYSNGGKLNLEEVMNAMNKNIATINTEGKINGEGFINPEFATRNGIEVLEAYGTDLVNLGNYFDTTFHEDTVTTTEAQYTFYSKARIVITEDRDLILKFDNSTEEKARGKVKTLVESLGFETTLFKLDDELLRKVQNDKTFEWSATKIDRIDKDGDKTTKVSYEIDLANDVHPSKVDDAYREHGMMSHIKFELPYDAVGSPNKISVNLYNNGHRVFFEENELGNSNVHDFVVYLMTKLKEL
ncbi:hypothetical protein [Salimicrobium album]|uniref:Uncharacterized protein n=1 Tax=Salimicrobium album TaxID=50717 RepID=A0A1H3DAD9_9BACI|nr:hypothetical protein [Salimicrobium album]SDX63317.1 hypothetical protein SAMN04488081_0887 [Salimicrobium album]